MTTSILFNVTRDYAHRKFGTIGRVAFRIDSDGKAYLSANGDDMTALPVMSVDHLLRFALQTFQDAYAGADSDKEARAAFTAKIDKVRNGTLGARESGVTIWQECARDAMRILVKASPERAKEYKAADPAGRLAMLDGLIASNAGNAKFAAHVDTMVKDAEAEAAKRLALASSLGDAVKL